MITGALSYNEENERYGLLTSDSDDWEIEGFHCGEALEVWDNGTKQWIPTRIEMRHSDEWYLVGYSGALEGLTIRVND